MSELKKFIESSNLLEAVLSLDDEGLFSYFKELSKIDFYLNRHGMKSKHKFTVFKHSKNLVKNFSLALKYREDKELYKKDLVNSTIYKRSFFKRIIKLIDELDLKTDTSDFRVIVLTLLLHDIGKYAYDKSDEEIIAQSNKSKKGIKFLSVDYLKIYYKNKDHDDRGAFLVYSKLEEAGMSQVFAARVRNTIIGHDDFGRMQRDKDFNFFTLIRHVMNHTTTYNYPIIRKENPDALLIKELNINYLVYMLDVFSVDDTGELWYSIYSDKETLYMRAKWLLGRKINDLIEIVRIKFEDVWPSTKKEAVKGILKKSFLQGLRGNTNFLLDTEFDGILPVKEKDTLIGFLNSYFSLTDSMYPFYLNNISPEDKIRHINLLSMQNGEFSFSFVKDKDDASLCQIHLVKNKAYEGTLLRFVRAIILSSISHNKVLKLVKLLAYSGEHDNLIDIITIKHKDSHDITDAMLATLEDNLQRCEEPGYTKYKLHLPISKADFDSRVENLKVEINDVDIGARSFQEIRVSTPVLSNLTMYCCLETLSYINIINVRVEEDYADGYSYIFLTSQLNRNIYRVGSAASFKADLYVELSRNLEPLD